MTTTTTMTTMTTAGTTLGKRTIVVYGATGHQGGATIDALLQLPPAPNATTDFAVRAVTRDPASASAAALRQRPGVDVVKGALGDPPAAVRAVVDGAWAVFLVTVPRLWGSAEADEGIAVVNAAFEAGVRRFVFTSGVGTETEFGRNTFIGAPKYAIENAVKSKPWPEGYIILRPDGFMENLEMFGPATRGQLRLAYPPTLPVPWIAARDIGRFAAAALTQPELFAAPERREIEIATETLSGEDMARILSEVTGEPWTYSPVMPLWLVRWIPHIQQMIDLFVRGIANPDYADLKTIVPDPTSFRDWCRQKGLASAGERPPGVEEYKYKAAKKGWLW